MHYCPKWEQYFLKFFRSEELEHAVIYWFIKNHNIIILQSLPVARKGHITPLNQGSCGSGGTAGRVLVRSAVWSPAPPVCTSECIGIPWATLVWCCIAPDRFSRCRNLCEWVIMDMCCNHMKSDVNAVRFQFKFDRRLSHLAVRKFRCQQSVTVICSRRFETLMCRHYPLCHVDRCPVAPIRNLSSSCKCHNSDQFSLMFTGKVLNQFHFGVTFVLG